MPTGTLTSYSQTGILKPTIADIISFIDPNEAALLDLFGVDNVKKFKLQNWPNTKYQWLEDAMRRRSGTIAEALDDTETGVDVTSGEGVLLKKGDIIKIDDELMYTASVASNTATVTRGFAGTTAASHLNGAAWKRATIARTEGADWTTGYTTTLDIPYNFTQIIAEAVKVTGSNEKTSSFGINDQMAHHVARLIGGGAGMGTRNKAGDLAIMLQNIFYYGQRWVGDGEDVSRAAGGFEYFVTSNVEDLSSRTLLKKDVEDLQQACFDRGGSPDHVIVNSYLKRKLTTIYRETVQTTRDERIGGGMITTIATDLGELRIVLDRFCPADRLYMTEKDKVGWIPLRPFDIYDRPANGDYKVKEILGEYGFVVMNEEAHGYLKNVSYTD